MTDITSDQSAPRFAYRRAVQLVGDLGGAVVCAARKHVCQQRGIASGIVLRPVLIIVVGITPTSLLPLQLLTSGTSRCQ